MCGVLVKPKQSATDPQPIAPKDFAQLMSHADATMQAAMLLALNCCMYASEVARLSWSDIKFKDGTIITSRNKTKVIRIACLWKRTLAALKWLPREKDHDASFCTEIGTRADSLCLYRLFKAVRMAAELPNLQFSQLRDASYTAAVEAGTSLDVCKLLAGHSTGVSDHYVARRPQMVAAACNAIGKAFPGPFPAPMKSARFSVASESGKSDQNR